VSPNPFDNLNNLGKTINNNNDVHVPSKSLLPPYIHRYEDVHFDSLCDTRCYSYQGISGSWYGVKKDGDKNWLKLQFLRQFLIIIRLCHQIHLTN
jgi:hypothetical protein